MERKKNILEYLEATVARLPDKTAFSNAKDSISFGELYGASRSIGAHLASLGLYREAVAVFMDKHPKTMAAFFGVIYSGCFYVCIDSAMPEDRVRLILENVSARAAIADAKNLAKASKFGIEHLICYDDIIAYKTDADRSSKAAFLVTSTAEYE